ncbi:MAG TPA: EAL domain-containing protein [Acidimicrobiales bacterium]|nr:EAL domain-containing protein [Acidimicrobiales bacterium]
MGPSSAGVGDSGPDARPWLEALRRASEAASDGATLEVAAAAVIDEVCAAAGWPVGRMLTVQRGAVRPTAVWRLSDPERFGTLSGVADPTAPSARLAERAAAVGKPVWTGDLAEVGQVSAEAWRTGLRGAVAFPVFDHDGVTAVLEFFADGSDRPPPATLDLAAATVSQLGRVADRVRAAGAAGDAQRMAEVAHDAFIAVDDHGRIVEWNPEAEAVFGWARREALGRPLAEIAVPARHRQAYEERLAELLAGDHAPVALRRELTALHRSGTEFPVQLTVWSDGRTGGGRICGFVRDLSERKRFEGQLASQALHDRLTGLPNRVLLRDRVQHALARAGRRGASVALLIADIDRFKVVNESLGHDGGDRLLVAVAERLTEKLRPGDTVARMGGDEFALLCEDVTGYEEAVAIASRVLAAFDQPFIVQEADISLTASVGVAVGALHGPAPELLLRDADVAMYRAKQGGRARFEVFDESMLADASRRLSVENDLRRAIADGQLRLYYQPIVHLDTGAIAGFEALVRWQHPERGLLPPLEFIPSAEESGLIVPLGRQVLSEACLQAATWKDTHASGERLRVSVNVSAKQLSQPGWSDEVAQVLAESGLAPRQLVLEITESVLMDDADATAVRLEELRRLGVRIAIDDFGTGYSSLGYLRRLPVDILKIDKSFIDGVAEGPHESALARAVVKLASTLRLEAVAEGINSRKQLLQLRRLRCPYGQGFFFSRPQPAAAIPGLLDLGVLEGVDPGE